MKKSFNTVSVLIFTAMGCFFAGNQYIVSNIASFFHATSAEMGNMVSALYLGSLLMVLFFGAFAARAGKRTAACVCSATIFAGSLIVCLSGSPAVATVGLFVYGMGLGGFESNIFSLLSDNNGDDSNRMFNLGQAFFSAGAVIAPIVMSAVLSDTRFRPVYAVISVTYACIFLYFLFSKKIDGFASKDEKVEKLSFVFKLVKNPYMVCYMLAMMIYIGCESVVTYWISDFFNLSGISGYAAAALSSLWFASIVGRLICAKIKDAGKIIAPCFLVTAAGAILLLTLPGALMKIFAIVVIGLGFAPLYAGLTYLGGNVSPENSSSSYSLMVFAAGVGGMLFQPLVSALMQNGSVQALYVTVTGLCVFSALITWLASRKLKS